MLTTGAGCTPRAWEGAVRLIFAMVFVIALVVLVAQLRADPQPSQVVVQPAAIAELPMIVGTSFPEPISTVFILGGASAMGLWRLVRKLEIV